MSRSRPSSLSPTLARLADADPRLSPRARGFTIVEMLISLTLSLVIIGMVYAGFRVATQSMVITERLSVENRLLVGGMLRGLDMVDFWTDLDRNGHTPLRTTPTKVLTPDGSYAADGSDWNQLGQPFTPFNASWPKSGATAVQNDGAGQYDFLWLANDPRTWYRGDPANFCIGDNWSGADPWAQYRDNWISSLTDISPYGNYAIFQSTGPAADPRPTVFLQKAPDPADPYPRQWLPQQQRGLDYGLGFFGWLSYLPANAIVDAYQVYDGPYNTWSDKQAHSVKLLELRKVWYRDSATSYRDPSRADHGQMRIITNWEQQLLTCQLERPVSRPIFMYTRHTGVTGPAAGATPAEQTAACRMNREMGTMDVGTSGNGPSTSNNDVYNDTLTIMSSDLSLEQPLLSQKPTHWPAVTVDVRRLATWDGFYNMVYVRQVDPISGRMIQVNFPALGTTLRGARLQRTLSPSASTDFWWTPGRPNLDG